MRCGWCVRASEQIHWKSFRGFGRCIYRLTGTAEGGTGPPVWFLLVGGFHLLYLFQQQFVAAAFRLSRWLVLRRCV